MKSNEFSDLAPITAESLAERFGLTAHVENGAFALRHYPSEEPGRPSSGAIYYYVAPEEYSKFHRLDCDEYWCYVKGSPLELWQFDEDGRLTVSMLGVGDGCEPLIWLRHGVTFGSRHRPGETEGTFLSCLTVPRFTYEGFVLVEDDEILRLYPAAKDFFSAP